MLSVWLGHFLKIGSVQFSYVDLSNSHDKYKVTWISSALDQIFLNWGFELLCQRLRTSQSNLVNLFIYENFITSSDIVV